MTTIDTLRDSVVDVLGSFTRRKGHTSDDVAFDLDPLSEWTGLNLVVLWDFEDMWGIGGNSEYAVVVPGKAGLYEAPSEISEYLFHEPGEPVIAPERLLGLKPGPWMKGSHFYHEKEGRNWCRRNFEGEAD